MTQGVDVSHHQDPASVPWHTLAQAGGFAIVRASYGSALRDRRAAEHTARARAAGVTVGAYHFYRPSQPWHAQAELYFAQLQLMGIGPGDIVPALDIEADPIPALQPVSPAWSGPCEQFAAEIARRFGSCLIYLTQREWTMLGSPAWVLGYPLWVAHYTARPEPATPGGKPWTIWQHRVGPFDLDGPGGYFKAPLEIDQNRARELPRIVAPKPVPPVPALDPPEDAELERLLVETERLRIDEIGLLRADALRELSEADTEPPPTPRTA